MADVNELIKYLHNIYKITVNNPNPKDTETNTFIGKISKIDILDNIDGIQLNQTQTNIRFSLKKDGDLLEHYLYYGQFFIEFPMFTGNLDIYIHIFPKSYSYEEKEGIFLYKSEEFNGKEITITKTDEYEVKTGDFGLSAQFTQKELKYPDYPSDETIDRATNPEDESQDNFYQLINDPSNVITANDGDDVYYAIYLLDMYDDPIKEEIVEFYNGNKYLGSARTDSNGYAYILLERIDIGIYNLTARYTNISSFNHRLIVIEKPPEYPDDSLIGQYDSIIHLKVGNTATNKILDETKIIAYEEKIDGEKVILENFPFKDYDIVLRQDYLNCEFFMGNIKLKHNFIDKNDVLVPIIEIPYDIFRSKINYVTCIIRDIDTIVQPDLSMYDYYYDTTENIYKIGDKNYRDIIQVSQLPTNAKQILTDSTGNESNTLLEFRNTQLYIDKIIDSYNSITAFSLKRFYSNYDDKYTIKYYPDFLYNKEDTGNSTNNVYTKNDYLKFNNSQATLLISMQNILQTKYEVEFFDYDYEANLFKNIIVNFKIQNNLTIQEIQSIIPEYVWNSIEGEKVVIKNYPFSEVNQYFNTNKNNMRMIIDGKECDYLYFNKDEYEFYILQIPYDKIIPTEIKVKSIVYIDKTKTYGNNYNITKHIYDMKDNVTTIGGGSSYIQTDYNRALRITDHAGFNINDFEYRDIIAIENNINNTNTYKSFLNNTNTQNNTLSNGTLTIGRDTNETGLFITPTPESTLNSTPNTNSIYTQIEDTWTMTRLMMLRQERWVQYQPDYIFDIDNFGKKEIYSYNDVDYLNYNGKYDISLLVAMQNPIQVKYKQQWKDNYYIIEYPNGTIDETGDIPDKGRFQHYNMVGTRQTVNPIAAQTLTDLTFVSGYYRGTKRTNPQTCTRTVYDTITPPDTVDTGGSPIPITVQATQQFRWDFPTTLNYDGQTIGLRSASLSFSIQTLYNYEPFSITIGSNVYNYHGTQTTTPYSFDNVVSPIIWQFNSSMSYLYIYNIVLTKKWNSYQKPKQEQYDCSTYYTNANFRSVNNLIESNTAELIVENNSQTISRITMYSSSNANLGNILTNINSKYATVNNRAGQSCNFELVYSQYDVNLFSALFMKNIYAEDLIDIGYEFAIKGQNGYNTTTATNAVNASINNRNIYSRKAILTIPSTDKRLKGKIREDKKNIRFIIKDQNILLNHYISGDNIYIEIPDHILKPNEMTINCIVLPLTYQYNGRSEVYNIATTMPFSNVEYEFY